MTSKISGHLPSAATTSRFLACARAAAEARDVVNEKARHAVACRVDSHRHAIAEELLVFVISALAGAQLREALDELNGLDPLHLFEPKLALVA